MFCNQCGTEIIGSNRFCSNCGAAVQQVTAAPASRPAATVPEKTWPEVFREGWRGFVASPLVLVMIICFSVVQLLNLFTMDSAMDALNILGGAGSSGMEAAMNVITSKLKNLGVLMLLPGILMAIGMWMVYIDSSNHSMEPIRTGGLTLIQTVFILELASLVFLMIFALATLSTLESQLGISDSSSASSVLSTLRTTIVVVLILVAVVFGLVITMLAKMRQTAVDCDPQGTGLVYAMGILTIISGVISVISLFSSDLTLAGVANCAYTLLLGIVLCKYKHVMEDLEYIYRTRDFGKSSASRGPGGVSAYPGGNAPSPNVRQSVQDNGYVPTWKRVQMNEAAAAPEAQKPLPEQPSIQAKKCPECGTTQSGSNQVCFYCGAQI